MTPEEFIEKTKPFHNHMCIMHDTQIVRLIGIAIDNSDYYYIVQTNDIKRPIIWGSAVGHFYSLMGIISDKQYASMENIFAMNHGKPTRVFIEDGGPGHSRGNFTA
jgi:hypothetical protein